MGQYKEWLHYREIDQLLRSQLAVSEHELAQLQAQVEILGKQNFSAHNAIFQALIKPQQDEWSQTEELALSYKEEGAQAATGWKEQIEEVEELVIEEVEEEGEEDIATISPALLAWSRLPNFDTQMIEEQEVNSLPRTPEPPLSQSPEQLLPSDISAFIDAQYPTNPQMKVPWWLHNITSPDQGAQETHASDQQSGDADYLVQRWFERWGKQPTKRSQEDQTP